MFDEFPRYAGIPNRFLVNSPKELSDIIFKYNGIRDIYIEIYKDKFVDKIMFDLDSGSCFLNVRKLHDYLMKHNLRHIVFFTGRGFHVYVEVKSHGVKDPRNALINVSNKIAKDVGLIYGDPKTCDLDHHIRGDLSRIARVPYTINTRSGLYCCSISEYMLRTYSFDEIKKYAKNPDRLYWKYGELCINLSEYDCYSSDLDIPLEDIPKVDLSVNVSEKLPQCISNMLRIKDLRYRDRYLLIVALKSLAFTENETKNILKKYLSEEKYKHCVFEEHQVRHVYRRDDMMSHDEIIRRGYCKGEGCILGNFYKRWNNGRK